MVELNFTVDESTLGNKEPVPEGVYGAQIVATEERTSQAGNKYLSMQIKLDTGRTIFDNLNLHSGETAKQIAERKLTQIGSALGLGYINDTEEFIAKPLRVKVIIKPKKPDENEIYEYLAPQVAAATVQPPVAETAAPTAAPTNSGWRS